MKAAESCWSRPVWLWGFVFLFLSHAFAVFWLAERRQVLPSWQKPAPFLYLSGSPELDQRLAENMALSDPTLFALPHAQGFSGDAWLNFQPQVLKLSNGIAAPQWLTLPVEGLGRVLEEYVVTNRPSDQPLLVSLRATRAPEVRIPDEPVVTSSTVKVEGSLASRKLIFVPPLPDIATNDVLARSIVTVSVNEDGVVESAAVAKESGSKLADEQALRSKWADDRALQLARSFAFEPLTASAEQSREFGLTFGRLVFAWNAVPPTNTVPPAARAASE